MQKTLPITQWLHKTLIENLPKTYLVSYIDVIQRLRSKVPVLIDKMVAVKTPETPGGTGEIAREGLRVLLKRYAYQALANGYSYINVKAV